MAATVSGVLEWLVSELEGALSVTVIRGYPSWGRPDLTVPCAALELAEWTPGAARIGQRMARQGVQFRFWVFARHEPGLCALLDSFTTWAEGMGSDTVDGERVDVRIDAGTRNESEAGVQQEDYSFVIPIRVTW